MVMVMPRSRSSGALSIWSKATYLLVALALASTLVMAAVKVVLPWSMWPIVPTFTCGFVLSNFFFAICVSSLKQCSVHTCDARVALLLWHFIDLFVGCNECIPTVIRCQAQVRCAHYDKKIR